MEKRPVWLRTDGNHIIVLIEENNEWKEIIRERIAGEISHIWEDNDP